MDKQEEYINTSEKIDHGFIDNESFFQSAEEKEDNSHLKATAYKAIDASVKINSKSSSDIQQGQSDTIPETDNHVTVFVPSNSDGTFNVEQNFDSVGASDEHVSYTAQSKDSDSETCDYSGKVICHIQTEFPTFSRETIIKTLKEIQDTKDETWKKVDEANAQQDKLPQELKKEYHKLLGKKLNEYFKVRKCEYVMIKWSKRTILDSAMDNISFGILPFDEEKEKVFLVQNHYKTCGPNKGHPRIKENLQFETRMEAALCEWDEEIKGFDIVELIQKPSTVYKEFELPSNYDHTGAKRLISLFIIPIDSSRYSLEIKNQMENQTCGWISLEMILSDKSTGKKDSY